MVETMIDYFISKTGSFVTWISNINIIPGIEGFSLGAFLAALFCVGAILRALLLRRKL